MMNKLRLKALAGYLVGALMLSHLALCQNPENQEITEYPDLRYVAQALVANDSLQRLDLYVPSVASPTPLLIWIGGGAWSYVDRKMEADIARKLAQQGIAVAAVGHRLSPATWRDPSMSAGVQHPKHVEDVASAVRWLYDHAAEYGYDTDQFFVGGYSSGGHLAALLTLDPSYLQAQGLEMGLFQGVIPISGAYDIENYYQAFAEGGRPQMAETHVQAVFGYQEGDLLAASPTHYLQNHEVPMLLMTDNTVFRYTRLYEDRIREAGITDVQVVYSYEFSHADLWRNMSQAEHSRYRNILVDFILSQAQLP